MIMNVLAAGYGMVSHSVVNNTSKDVTIYVKAKPHLDNLLR